MWKEILNQLNAAIFANWKWLLAGLVGIVLGAVNCGGVADVVHTVVPQEEAAE